MLFQNRTFCRTPALCDGKKNEKILILRSVRALAMGRIGLLQYIGQGVEDDRKI
jgi:hypothetical protein